MPQFRYEALNKEGRVVNGAFAAETVAEVEAWLARSGMSPVSVRIAAGREQEEEAKGPSWWERLQGVKLEDLILFCRQTGTMLGAGIAILQSLRVIGKQVRNPLLQEAVTDIANRVEGGERLSDAFGHYPNLFTPLFLNLVRVGEETGGLDRSFDYLALLYENEKAVQEKIKSATRYPKIVITALVGAMLFLMTFVMPKFVTLFASSKVELPLPTRIMIGSSNFITGNFVHLIMLVVVLVVCYRLAMRSENFVLARDRLRLRLPIFGQLGVKIYMARFCRVFSVLTLSGVDIVRSLALAATALENLVLTRMMDNIRHDVEEGRHLSEAMGDFPDLPPLVREMVTVGEQTGRMDEMMSKVADYYDTESDYTIKNLATLIEPVLLLVLGVMVGLFALAIFMPMWDMMGAVKG